MGRPLKVSKIKKICIMCTREFYVYKNREHSAKLCSNECKHKYQIGINNSNYGNNWSVEQRKLQSLKFKELYKNDANYRFEVGKSNRGQKFSEDRIIRMHGHRTKESYIRRHSAETKKIIGQKSKEKFTPKYKEKMYNKGVIGGKIIPDEEKTDFRIYQEHSRWIRKMWNLGENQELLTELGIFNAKTNKKGCVRDHILSKFDGFKLGLFPEILRHPANCMILSHCNNSSKREKSNISHEKLFDKIRNYDKVWEEQELVLQLITRWELGERFSAQTYRRKSL